MKLSNNKNQNKKEILNMRLNLCETRFPYFPNEYIIRESATERNVTRGQGRSSSLEKYTYRLNNL